MTTPANDPRAPISLPDCLEILGLAAGMDVYPREPSELRAALWLRVLHGMRAGDAMAAAVEHYQGSREPLMPSDLWEAVGRWQDQWIAKNHGGYNEQAPIGGRPGRLVAGPDLSPADKARIMGYRPIADALAADDDGHRRIP